MGKQPTIKPTAAPALEPGPLPAAKCDPSADIQAPPITVDMLQSTEGHRLSLRLERLRKLARRDADVAWLLAQCQGFSKALKP